MSPSNPAPAKARYSVRLPKTLRDRYKLASIIFGKPSTALFEEALEQFMSDEPWETGTAGEATHAVPSVHNGFSGDEGSMQVGLYLPMPLVHRLDCTVAKLAKRGERVSKSSLIYTAALWRAREQRFPDVPPSRA